MGDAFLHWFVAGAGAGLGYGLVTWILAKLLTK